MGRNASGTDMPEFHIVVRRPARLGPIAPYRFAIAVAVAIAVTFGELRAAIFDGAPADEVLVRALVAAGFTWIMLTVLNRVLAAAPPEPTASTSDPDF